MIDLETFAIASSVFAGTLSVASVLVGRRSGGEGARGGTVTVTIEAPSGTTRYVSGHHSAAGAEELRRTLERALESAPEVER